jgi:TetR/AcrR family transcriptional regulator, transcriptional repressor for nem operon
MARPENTEARERILQSAQQLIFESGLKGVSMADVAVAAGLKKANLFHYYPTKDALALAVFDFASASAKQWFVVKFSGESDPVRAVERIFDETVESMKANSCTGGCFVGNAAQELADENEQVRLRLAEIFVFWVDQLAAFLDRARAFGHFRTDFQPRRTAEAVVALFEGSVLLAKTRKDSGPIESAKELAVGYLTTFRT